MSHSVRPHRRPPTRLRCPWDSPGKNTGVGCHFLLQCSKVKSESEVTQSCPTLSNSMGWSLPGSSVHGSFQTRVLEGGASAFSFLLLGLINISHTLIYLMVFYTYLANPQVHSGKESACHCRRHERCGFNPCVEKIPWRRKWQPSPVLLPGESHGRRSLVGYGPWGSKRVVHNLVAKQQHWIFQLLYF